METSHLDVDVELVGPVSEMTLPALYVRLGFESLATSDSGKWNKRSDPVGMYQADAPENQARWEISPATVLGWLRYGCERVVQVAGASVCHTEDSPTDTNRVKTDGRELPSGYHAMGSCTSDRPADCLICELFGNQSGKLRPHPVSVPLNPRVEAEPNGEQRADHHGVSPYFGSDGGGVGTVEGTWKFTLSELKPEFVGLLVEAVSFLDSRGAEDDDHLGENQPSVAAISNARVINPLYSQREVRRDCYRTRKATSRMVQKDAEWRDGCRDAFVRALQARLAMRDSDVPMPDPIPGGDGL